MKGIICRTCKESINTENCDDFHVGDLKRLIANQAAIVRAFNTIGTLIINKHNEIDVLKFLSKHTGHELDILNDS